MIYATMLAGKLGWSLTQRTPHRAGDILQFTISIINNTDAERQFKVWIGLFNQATGAVIETGPLAEVFTVSASSEFFFSVSPRINYSDCIMQASLYDIATGEMGAALQTILEQPPPSPIEQATPAITAITGIAAMGMIISIIPEMLVD